MQLIEKANKRGTRVGKKSKFKGIPTFKRRPTDNFPREELNLGVGEGLRLRGELGPLQTPQLLYCVM